ncbi:MAG: DUF3857 domain-containing transglutaminase family protein [Holophagales bacterium]|nr:DUF3857 domain-containing transglutaminase family protein [Holophagales bacterium]MBK9964784.1 DUF3857 domain-containing transglutaminase family protein [Holophagales bacterium]
MKGAAGRVRSRLLLTLAVSVLSVAPEAAGVSAPRWLADAAVKPSPAVATEAPAVELLLDHEITVSSKGVVTTHERRVVRLLKASGSSWAREAVVYMTDTERVSGFDGWVVRGDGSVTALDDDQVVDMAASPNDAFNESRIRFLDAAREAGAGDVVGFEWTRKGPSLLGQVDWPFQGRLPSVTSRLSVTLPEGWTVAASSLEGPAPHETRTGDRTSWELRDLPYIPDEPLAPHISGLAPRIAVTWRAPAGGSPPNAEFGHTFASWPDVSRFLSGLSEPQAEPTAAIRDHALARTQGATTERAKVEALCKAAQKVAYVSVQLGVGRGGGYRPHSADEVLRKGHGDCKDKATLLRSLLRVVGVRSWPVVLYSGDSSFVRKEWPSPQQFDHVILAIELKELPEGAPTVSEAGHGTLVLFDPTSETVPFGDLPASDRFGWGLVVRPEGGMLVRMPGSPAGGFLEERLVNGAIRPDGSIAGMLTWRAEGPMADSLRHLSLSLTSEELARGLEKSFSDTLTGIRVASGRLAAPGQGRSGLEIELTGQTQSRAMAGGLLLMRPAFASWSPLRSLPAGPRTLPVVLVPKRMRATYELQLPAGHTVDDAPDPVKVETPYGRVVSEVRRSEKGIVLSQELSLGDGSGTVRYVPAAEYEAVRRFFAAVREALNPAVVLKR